jgi:hypothetical protein
MLQASAHERLHAYTPLGSKRGASRGGSVSPTHAPGNPFQPESPGALPGQYHSSPGGVVPLPQPRSQHILIHVSPRGAQAEGGVATAESNVVTGAEGGQVPSSRRPQAVATLDSVEPTAASEGAATASARGSNPRSTGKESLSRAPGPALTPAGSISRANSKGPPAVRGKGTGK